MERLFYTSKGAARAVGCCTATLRAYERDGLLSPARDSAGRRIYTAADIERARRIKADRAEVARRALEEGRHRFRASQQA